jgi:hypothetical protein
VDMKGALDTTFIVVGSVGPTGISDFSNRPGTTCLTDGASPCKYSASLKESGYLMNRFIVAPGELILVSDGAGGSVRQSGTSLAAPMVAGAVALIQDRWPWMREKPRDIAKVILESAKDLGDPGTDPVYGVGMLDIEAAMAPLDFSKLRYYLTDKAGKQSQVAVGTLSSRGVQPSWATGDMYFTAFEPLEEVERDFLIPLSTRLYGTMRQGEYFQDYVYNRMVTWMGTSGFAGGPLGIGDRSRSRAIGAGNGWTMQMTGRLASDYSGDGRGRRTALRSTVQFASPSGATAISLGLGDGAAAIGGQAGMSLASDFDPYSGGVNPLLGFASGGAHVGVRTEIARGLQIKAGFSQERRSRGLDLYDVGNLAERVALGGLARYRARATSIQVEYGATDWLRISAAATQLSEPNAFLGVRSLASSDLAGGTSTQGMTVGAEVSLGHGVSLFGTGTGSRSRSVGSDSALRIGRGGVLGSAYQVGIGKQGLFSAQDAIRVTMAQPLRMERGRLELGGVQVIDRSTGEKGYAVSRFDLSGVQPRRMVVEGNYATQLLDGVAEVSMFGRGEVGALDPGTARLMLGSQLRVTF